MSTTLEQLIAQLNGMQSYKPLTEEERRAQALRRFESLYSERRNFAGNAYQSDDAALLREIGSLRSSYAGQQADTEAGYRRTRADTARDSLSRGMQRSSYLGSTLANIDLSGLSALRKLADEQSRAEGNVQERRTALSQRYAQQLQAYAQSQQSDVLAYMDELEARDYDRNAAAEKQRQNLAAQIYEYQHELEKEEAAYNAKYGRSRSGGSATPGGQTLLPPRPASIAKRHRQGS